MIQEADIISEYLKTKKFNDSQVSPKAYVSIFKCF